MNKISGSRGRQSHSTPSPLPPPSEMVSSLLFDFYLIVNKLSLVGFDLTTLTLILKTERGL